MQDFGNVVIYVMLKKVRVAYRIRKNMHITRSYSLNDRVTREGMVVSDQGQSFKI